jgi:hypothetical protein
MFFIANLSTGRAPKFFIDIAKTQYLANQKKLQGKIQIKSI